MSSGLLYLVIVGVWACVLVPMWVRRSDVGEEHGADSTEGAPEPWSRPHPRILARRRRRLTGAVAFLLVTIIVAAAGWAPWWSVIVPSLVLVGLLACLRAAATYDAELAEQELPAEEASEQEPGRAEAVATTPKRTAAEDPRVIDFPLKSARPQGRPGARDELFDQYADSPPPAVGD